MRHFTQFVSTLTTIALIAASAPALAQDQGGPPGPPPGPPPPPSAQAPGGEYVSPMQQRTQQVYVPQSVAMSGPREIHDWDDSQPVPPGYHVSQHARKGMIAGGAALFGALYLISVLTAAGASDAGQSGDGSLYIPGVGPFLQMATTGSSLGNVFLAIDGLGQCAGLAMFIYGFASPKLVLTRNDLGLRVMPMKLGRDGYGMGLSAHF
jgi:hypothetical protein